MSEVTKGDVPDLGSMAASQIEALLAGYQVDSRLDVTECADLEFTLELLVPEILRSRHDEWDHESLDGFLVTIATKTGDQSVSLFGASILISDQTLTPFQFDIDLLDANTIQKFRVRLGEAGSGRLGISGPSYNSSTAEAMIANLPDRITSIEWSYDVMLQRSVRPE